MIYSELDGGPPIECKITKHQTSLWMEQENSNQNQEKPVPGHTVKHHQSICLKFVCKAHVYAPTISVLVTVSNKKRVKIIFLLNLDLIKVMSSVLFY